MNNSNIKILFILREILLTVLSLINRERFMNKRLTLILACLFLMLGTALAQTQITGTVVSSEDGEPVIGASVKVVGTKTGTVTNTYGQFQLSVPSKSSQLEFTYIGMVPKTLKAQNGMKVVLDPENKSLDEVIVVAYGSEKRSAFTGSATVVGSKEIGKLQVTSPVEALKGKVAGVQMTNASGRPGSTSSIRVRGISSITAGNDPLIVVDGSPYEGDINTISPDDIENITVLKDAASSALYGSRGSNGVIIVTTKSAKAGEGTITVDAKWGSNSRAVPDYKYITSPARYYEIWYAALKNYASDKLGYSAADAHVWANKNVASAGNTDYGLGYNVYTVPEGQTLIGTNGKLNPNATLGRTYTYNGNEYYIQPDDWADETFKNSLRQEYTVTGQGSNDKGSFYMSGNYLKLNGLTVSSNYERYTGRFKADYKIKPWLKLIGNMNYTHYNQNWTGDEGSSGSSGNVFALTKMGAIYPIYIRDGKGNIIHDNNSGIDYYDYGDAKINGLYRPYLSQANPLSSNQLDESKVNGNTVNLVGTAEVTFLKDFKFSSINNIYVDESRQTNTTNPFYGQYASSKGIIYKYHMRSFTYDLQQLLNWSHTFGEHTVSAMLGHDYYDNRYYYLYGSKTNQFDWHNDELAGAITKNGAESYRSEYNNESYLGRVLYDYMGKYHGEVSLMRQASSRFHPDHRWGTFWSAGAAWLITKEEWFKVPFVNELKLKASYGQTGNDRIGSYLYTNRYSITPSNGNVSLVASSTLKNEKITWEKVNEFNAGLDFTILNSRISGTIEGYTRTTKDMLYAFSLPLSYGYSSYYDNIGDMRNSGFELTLNGDVIKTKDFTWSLNLNVTNVNNKVTRLPDEKKTLTVDGVQGYTDGSYFVGEGIALYTWRLHKYAGVNPDTGEALYYKNVKDDSGKVTGTTTTTNASEADYYLCNGSMAKWYGGFGTTAQWQGFDLSVSFAYQLGGKIFDADYQSAMALTKGYAFHADLDNAWSETNKGSNIPRIQYGDTYTAATSDRWLTSATYLSLQNINLGYTIPKNLVRKIGLQSVRLYGTADNIWVWSKRQGLDPRQTIAGSGNQTYAPSMRTISGGITVTF